MTVEQMFEKHKAEYLKFYRVAPKANARPDLNAFILLQHLFPGNGDVVTVAEHDQIWLFPSQEQIASLTEGQVKTLIRCGVFYWEDEFLSVRV